ncbi:MAG: transcriptional regulator, GntR family [Symbiobacteriaceae bacterium]|jgi:GntR family transcriptional regulator|nr:transcriptional regulator, GntR family [Symbiobacteriaceae bacterium]
MARDTVPRHQAIEAYLRERIAAGQPGDLLPTEMELCEMFAVSRMTARQAVIRLAEAGLVRREPGRGTFVAHPRLQREISTLLSFTRNMEQQGRHASSKMLSVTIEPAKPEVSARLNLAPGSSVIRIRRVRFADDEPMALESVQLPADQFAWLAGADLAHQSLHVLLEERGIIPHAGEGTLTADIAAKDEAHLLEIPVGGPLMIERLVLHDQTGSPIQVGETRYAGQRYALDFHLHRNG